MSMSQPMTFRKLEKSLLLRVEQRLRELLPDAKVVSGRHTIKIRWDDLRAEIPVKALTRVCMDEDRQNWGAIAGGFCNLVVARVEAYFEPAVTDPSALDRVYPAVLPNTFEDAMIDEAAPTEGMLIASDPWLDGLRIEFDYRIDGAFRRLFLRDLQGLGMTASQVAQRASDNMEQLIDRLPIQAVGASGPDRRIFRVRSEGTAPAMLRAPAGHQAMLDSLAAAGEEVTKVLACAPRSDLLYFCNMRQKEAASRLVALAWEDHEQDDADSVPLSTRLFTVAERGQVKYLDVGISPERVPGWEPHTLDFACLHVPADWWVREQDGRHVIWRTDDGPRIRVRLVDSGAGSALAAHELAERVRARHATDSDIGHGFFNALPWAWVDTGNHEGFATASMFVVFPTGMAIVQTEIPETATAADQITLQKIIATVSAA